MSEPKHSSTAARESVCPGDEILLAFLSGSIDLETTRRLDTHLDACDACLGSVMHAQSRLSRDLEMSEPVPDEIRVRLAAVLPQRAATSAGAPAATSPSPRRIRHLPIPPAFRYLAPLALAAGLLVTLSAKTDWFSPQPSQRLTRAVSVSQDLRVGAREATVYAEPHSHSQVIATLKRGDLVKLSGEDREWYRVRMPSGGEGWVEQEVFH